MVKYFALKTKAKIKNEILVQNSSSCLISISLLYIEPPQKRYKTRGAPLYPTLGKIRMRKTKTLLFTDVRKREVPYNCQNS